MKSLFVTLVLLSALLPSAVRAGTESGSTDADVFGRMDADHDGAVIREEFHRLLPQMRQEAFDSIDSSHDGRISREEWNDFRLSHGRSGMRPMNRMHQTSRQVQEKMPSQDRIPPVLPGQEMVKPDILPPVTR